MIYGMYRSAAGMMAATYKQGLIANNLANTETMGFKRDFVVAQQRRLGAEERPELARFHDPFFSGLGGGTLLSPTYSDATQGSLEITGKGTDAAIEGEGYFVVEKGGQRYLTRNGNFMLSRDGELILADGSNAAVLSREMGKIVLDPLAKTEIGPEGWILQGGLLTQRLAVKQAESGAVRKVGQQLLVTGDVAALPEATKMTVRGGALERSNVHPASELTQMMETQRLMEANANMIRYQDQTLGRLVSDVGRMS